MHCAQGQEDYQECYEHRVLGGEHRMYGDDHEGDQDQGYSGCSPWPEWEYEHEGVQHA